MDFLITVLSYAPHHTKRYPITEQIKKNPSLARDPTTINHTFENNITSV